MPGAENLTGSSLDRTQFLTDSTYISLFPPADGEFLREDSLLVPGIIPGSSAVLRTIRNAQ